ncbi:hypothetical protein [Micromonospora palomenae]|uniref:hypothetical protein n=1 Tax=Micromonospora palomenae TaxID=1461247 RepID=UPI003F88983B
MNVANIRSNTRSLLGLSAVSLAVAAVIFFAPRSAEAERDWEPPAGYVNADTVSLESNRTLRLWAGPSGWYVESLASGQHEAAVGASGGGNQYSVSEVLDGLVGYVPLAGTEAVSIRSHRGAVRQDVHAGVFLIPASGIAVTDVAILVTPLDANGRPLAGETQVPIAGRA